MELEISLVNLEVPAGLNVIAGQAHFIKTVEDIHEAVANVVPGGGFGLAFNEASGPRLLRQSGTSPELVEIAAREALRVGAGHFFLLILAEGIYPLQIIPALRAVPELVTLYAATANPLGIVVASMGESRGVIGVIDGWSPLGIEGPAEMAERKNLLRSLGYKL